MALRPLSTVPDLRLPPPAFDVRGWQVRTETDDHKVGKVEDMLLDGEEDLRFLEVDLGFMKKHVLVPAHRAHVDETEEVIWIEDMTEERLEALPEYDGDPTHVTGEYEQRLDAAFAGYRSDDAAPAPAPTGTGDGSTLPLARLSDLDDYRVAGDDPRGWDVITAEGQKVGDVKELLVDTASMRARYVVCDVDEKRLELEPLDRHVLLPVSRVQLNPDKKRVLANALFKGDLATYPVYGGLPLTRQQADEIEAAFPTPAPDAHRGPRRGSARHFFGRRMGEDAARPDARGEARRDERANVGSRHEQAAVAARGVANEEGLAEEERSRLLARESTAAERELRRERDERERALRGAARTEPERARAAEGEIAADRDEDEEQRRVIRAREGEPTTIRRGDDEVRIEVQGDDIIIQRRPRD